ncbi:hypothetical protein L596_008822 [Steinernema carpocapsae]|uniref:Uncharacterized protein n=1 Tax=Steinernema carpocapsae TaxID=34508 RepID=A0A4U5PER8_STECR|nr:hypothetical protein L596_008822 [Steinernema carpocapsae]
MCGRLARIKVRLREVGKSVPGNQLRSSVYMELLSGPSVRQWLSVCNAQKSIFQTRESESVGFSDRFARSRERSRLRRLDAEKTWLSGLVV